MSLQNQNLSKYQKELQNAKTKIITNCFRCDTELILLKWDYESRIKKNNGRVYCSSRCSTLSRPDEIKQRDTDRIRKVALSQKGTSRPECGRKGHEVSQETRDKIRQSKLGKPSPKDTEIILSELKNQYYQKAVTTIKLVPDAILFRDGKLIAFELEKKKWETDVRRKMKQYDNDTRYDEVIIVWYSPEGIRLKEYRKIAGEWSVSVGDELR